MPNHTEDSAGTLARDWRVEVGTETTSARSDPGADGAPLFICAHGAGGNMYDRSTAATARALNGHGIGTVRFNFLYREKKSSRPDPMAKLTATIAAVVERTRAELNPPTVVLGGRSMGGRAASMLVADGFRCDGLLLFAYPLHPPGKPEQLRDAHLPRITVPVLCFNGTRDPFCTRELMDEVLRNVRTDWEMRWVEGADHSFHVPRSSGRTDADVLDEITASAAQWVRARAG